MLFVLLLSALPRVGDAQRGGGDPTRRQRWLDCIRGMLELQSRGVNDETEWLEFVTSEVELVHPITPYRSCSLPHRQSTDCVLVGTQALVRDMITSCASVPYGSRCAGERVLLPLALYRASFERRLEDSHSCLLSSVFSRFRHRDCIQTSDASSKTRTCGYRTCTRTPNNEAWEAGEGAARSH